MGGCGKIGGMTLEIDLPSMLLALWHVQILMGVCATINSTYL